LTLAKSGEGEGLWIRADRQTAGRGRLGREWVSPPGNLYASVLIRLRDSDPPAATLGFVAAVAVHMVLKLVAPNAGIRIKWPNDVVFDGAKLSGILLEREGDAVVTGIGVNLASHPDLPDRRTTSLFEVSGRQIEPDEFLEALAPIYGRVIDLWRTQSLENILSGWQARAHPIGTKLSVNLPDGARLDGEYEGLARDGALNLRLADGALRVIHAGDVFLV
jgi:BirA family transcriptional regulator, biotin operon repressor / biotin---[acetyl-CoA-carboxylase] ligase